MAECENCGKFGHRIPNAPGQGGLIGSSVTLDDNGKCPQCAMGRYYWHESIAREMRYLADERAMRVVPVATIAANMLPIPRADTRRHVAEMVGWGELVEHDDSVELAR